MNVSLHISSPGDTNLADKLISFDGALRDDRSICNSIALEPRSPMLNVRVVCLLEYFQMDE